MSESVPSRTFSSIVVPAVLTASALLTACPDGVIAEGEGEGEGEVDRGPTSIPLDGDPNGLALRDDGTLLIADDNNNRVLSYVDGVGTAVFADLPTAAASMPRVAASARCRAPTARCTSPASSSSATAASSARCGASTSTRAPR